MIQFGVGLLLFMAYYTVFLVIDRNHPTLPKIISTPKAPIITSSKPSSNDSISSTLKIKETKTEKKQDKEIKANKADKTESNILKSVKQKKIKVPAIKTNKVSTRNFGFGRKRRSKQNIS